MTTVKKNHVFDVWSDLGSFGPPVLFNGPGSSGSVSFKDKSQQTKVENQKSKVETQKTKVKS